MSTFHGTRLSARTFLLYGLLAGLLAGLATFAVAHTIGETPINQAIAVEDSTAHEHADAGAGTNAAEHSHVEMGPVSRSEQSGPGLATGTILVSLVLGGLTGILSAFAVGRLGGLGAIATTALVSLGGFVSFSLVPWLKFPPNPPAVGSPSTIGERTALWFSFTGVSVVMMLLAFWAGAHLARSGFRWLAVVGPALGYLAIMVVFGFVFAPIDEVGKSFPADTLFTFRVASILTLATLWASVGLALTGLLARRLRPTRVRDRTLVNA